MYPVQGFERPRPEIRLPFHFDFRIRQVIAQYCLGREVLRGQSFSSTRKLVLSGLECDLLEIASYMESEDLLGSQ